MGDSIDVGGLSRRRRWSDRTTQWIVSLGGAAVIGAIALIFAYLLWVVAPIFVPGSISPELEFATAERYTKLVDVSENGEVYLRISADGIVEYFDSATGAPVAAYDLDTQIKHAERLYPTVDTYLLIDTLDQVHFIRSQYIVSFQDDIRVLTPRLDFPFGRNPLAMQYTRAIDAHLHDTELVIVGAVETALEIYFFRGVEPGLNLGTSSRVELKTAVPGKHLVLGPRNEWLTVVADSGQIEVLDIKPLNALSRIFQGRITEEDTQLTAVMGVLGRYSLIAADDKRRLTQWSLLRRQSGTRLENLRELTLESPAVRLVSEPRRKGFLALEQSGLATLLYPTSERDIASFDTGIEPVSPMAISPRSNILLTAPAADRLAAFELDNKHPEISFKTLWGKVWYEGYEEPIYSWQSSSADNDFEPKFSLMPLAFGTLKAAFYALLFAVPIAIMGAIYTAYFMAPAMRAWVKPGIEIMAALPTVILGFIGGLWLAPIIESNLSSVLGILVVLPIGLFLFALLWSQIPERLSKPFAGWYGLLVAPLIVITVYLAFDVGPFLEEHMFGGDSKTWFREVLGLSYDQRNALVVGIIMGLAVTPNIFSIAEDAIYGVPTHLINGSLALGATPWQTLTGVVLLTASPGIFSGVMIGMGRAVGETMIVLMATGNTPLMDFNIFEGMRTFAANIAVELPESEVDSSHYRILFLAALVLFVLTFFFNTAAEVVRQRLRVRYGSL